MFLEFEKWHGCRNDFIVIWVPDLDSDIILGSLKRQAMRLCDRHSGIGADGLLVLRTKKRDDLMPDRLVIINSDGSLARNCGNGLRCAALSIFKRHRKLGDPLGRFESLEVVELDVEGRSMVCRFLLHGQSGKARQESSALPLVAVEMGVPLLGSAVAWYSQAKIELERAAVGLKRSDLLRDWDVCDVGNPHLVIALEQPTRGDLMTIGPILQKNTLNPDWDGINVHLIQNQEVTIKDQARAGHELGQELGDLYKVLVWERGAGETQACGSGACAVAAYAARSGLLERQDWIGVDMPGGRLYVKYERDDEPIVLAGPGAFVYGGEVEI